MAAAISSPVAAKPAPAPARAAHVRHNLWAIALTVTMATFMELLDTSIWNVSLPHIAGGLAPVEQAILVDTFPKEQLGGAFALYSMAIVTAPAVGPPLGAWITDNFSWRWVFFINPTIEKLISQAARTGELAQSRWPLRRQDST